MSYQDLGVATSSATFFRMIGGSFGTAVFGAIYTIVFTHTLAPTLARVPASIIESFNPQTINPGILDKLKSTAEGLVFYGKYIDAVTHAVQVVFVVAVPICFLAFLLSFLLPEVELRKTVQTVDLGEVRGRRSTARRSRRSRLALERVSARENRAELYHTLAQRAGIDLPARSCWLLYRLADQPAASVSEVADRLRVDPEVIQPGVDGLSRRHDRGAPPGRPVRPAPHGRGHDGARQAHRGRRTGLTELLEGWNPEEHPEIIEMVKHLAHALLADDERMVADAMPRGPRPRPGPSPGPGPVPPPTERPGGEPGLQVFVAAGGGPREVLHAAR